MMMMMLESDNESFELRQYNPHAQSNLPFGTFKRVASSLCYLFDLSQLSIHNNRKQCQVYPNDPTKCFYRPIPAGKAWYVLADATELLASIDYHDHYAYFDIPSKATHLYWVQASSLEEAITMCKNVLK